MATKTVTTIQTIKLDGKVTGLIMQDEAGYFYRPKGKSGLHSPKWDGQHFPTEAAVMKSINGDSQATQATAEPAKGAKASQAKEQAPKAPKAPTKAPTAPKETAKAEEGTRWHEGLSQELEQLRTENAQLKAASSTYAGASKVRYKLVEASGTVGTHFWLYAGYEHAKGFKWNSSGGFMFLNMEAVESFLFLNGIALTSEVEKADVSHGHYDPNKGVVLHYKSGQQQALL